MAKWRIEWPRLLGVTPRHREPRPSPDVITVRQLVNRWYRAKKALHAAGELSPTTLRKYKWIGTKFADAAGRNVPVVYLDADTFLAFRKTLDGYTLSGRGDLITQVRGIFKWGVGAGLIDREPVYGPEFRQPSRSMKRKARHEAGSRVIPADDIRYLWINADVHMRAVILLGINTGMKTLDIATLGPDILDLKRGVIDGVRRKRWTPMYAPLWPETITAIEAARCASGPMLQWQGRLPWNGVGTDRIGREFKALRDRLGLPAYTHGRLRHTLRTIGGEVDYRGVRRVMGHLSGDVLDETYDHGRLEAACQRVVDAVRWWVFTA
jgi:integrase